MLQKGLSACLAARQHDGLHEHALQFCTCAILERIARPRGGGGGHLQHGLQHFAKLGGFCSHQVACDEALDEAAPEEALHVDLQRTSA